MTIEVEFHDIDSVGLTCDYYLDGRYFAERFPIEEVELWAENNSALDWFYIKKLSSGEDDVIEGKWDNFYDWAKERFGEDEVKSFLEWRLREV